MVGRAIWKQCRSIAAVRAIAMYAHVGINTYSIFYAKHIQIIYDSINLIQLWSVIQYHILFTSNITAIQSEHWLKMNKSCVLDLTDLFRCLNTIVLLSSNAMNYIHLCVIVSTFFPNISIQTLTAFLVIQHYPRNTLMLNTNCILQPYKCQWQ